ncbi:hypothetical protein [Lentisalinibacter orientalis]|uniref:hypothetical protein n=1 Tax=Lentisalinibacter orientalis TaxID=2992241 RepID=UPI00386C2A51
MNSRLLLTVVVLAALALLALIGLQRALEEAVREREKSQPAEEGAPPAATPRPDGDGTAPVISIASADDPAAAADDDDCLSYAEARRDPGLQREIERLREVGLVVDDMDAYRHVDESALQSMAGTGDTAAMMVLGQRHFLTALGRDPDLAVDLLTGQAVTERGSSIDTEAIDRTLLGEAGDWFNRAALHGRVYALQRYGDALSWREGMVDSPVRLGWVTAADWEEMPYKERLYWYPGNVYSEVVYDVAPALATGISGVAYELLMAKSDKTQPVRDRIVRGFLADRQKAGLPALDIPVSDFDPAAFEQSLCPGVAERLDW